jgi:hypothetical protein
LYASSEQAQNESRKTILFIIASKTQGINLSKEVKNSTMKTIKPRRKIEEDTRI